MHMEESVYVPIHCQISLREILELQDQPVSEEQAWALCYQLSTLLSEDRSKEDGLRKKFQLRGANGILFTNDGHVRLKLDDCSIDDYFSFDTEDKAVDYLGRLVYSCLDWGLGSNVERELNESLEVLVCQMTKVNLGQDMKESFQPVCTLAEVIQICEDRLYDPTQARHHYRAICATVFSETLELCRYLRNIQCTRQTLRKLVVEPETKIVPRVTASWCVSQVFTWKHLVEEFSRGVTLRPGGDRLNVSAPLPVEYSPFEQLLRDIQLRRFKLRSVQKVEERRQFIDPHEALLEFVRSRPKLRPVSSRKLKTLHKESSMHELLMEEIRTVDRGKLFASHKGRLGCKDDGCSPQNTLSMCADSSSEDNTFQLNPILTHNFQVAECEAEFCDEKLSQQAINTTVDQELKFLPVLSSSPMNPDCGWSQGKRRSRSLSNNLRFSTMEKNCGKVCVPLTIAEVIKERQKETRALKTMCCDRYINCRVCSYCSKKSLYFTWHNSCSLCNRVVCPECCLEMRLPFKWCVNLPMNFFKKIVLSKDSEQGIRLFWRERWAWDCSRVPLVLESRVTSSVPLHSLAMRDWHSQDICLGCKGYLLDACDSVIGLCTNAGPREI